jgi:hypothetical protein
MKEIITMPVIDVIHGVYFCQVCGDEIPAREAHVYPIQGTIRNRVYCNKCNKYCNKHD